DDADEEEGRVGEFLHPLRAGGTAEALAGEGGQFLDEDDRQAAGEGEGNEGRDEDIEVRAQVTEEKAGVSPGGAVPDFFRRGGIGHRRRDSGWDETNGKASIACPPLDEVTLLRVTGFVSRFRDWRRRRV